MGFDRGGVEYMISINIKQFDKLSPSQWEEKIFYRGVQVKFPEQLKYLIDEMYPEKIARLAERLKEDSLNEEDAEFLNAKILRLTDKYATCKKMYDLRQAKAVPIKGEWAMHGTVYYIDLDGGNDGADGLGTGTAWLTLEKYTTTTVRTAGDIAYVRANTTETVGANDIVFDEDGTVNAYISIIGCDSVANDPWSDSSDVRPIIDFGDQIKNMAFDTDDYWKLERLDIMQSADVAGIIYCNKSDIYILNCIIRDNSAATGNHGLHVVASNNIKVESCQFLDNISRSFFVERSSGIIDSCVFNGGVTTTDRGIYANDGSTLLVKNCSFGQTTAHDVQDITVLNSSFITTINCKRQKSTYASSLGSVIFAEDDNQVKGTNVTYGWNGIITKDTGVVRSGGASSSAKLAPSSSCGLYAPLSIAPFNDYDFKVYCPASATTLILYLRSLGVWAGYPTNTELYVEVSYLDHAADATRSVAVSTAVLADETTWVAFPVTFTPLQAGYVYLKVYLKKFEASKGCYVDMKINNKLFDWAQAMPIEWKPSSTGFVMM